MGRGNSKDNAPVTSRASAAPIQPDSNKEFTVQARRLKIIEHPNADALELAQIDDYRAVVKKGQYKTGQLALYIPEQSILPEHVIADLGLEGMLAGGTTDENGNKIKNRVKPVRLRQELSQGLVYIPEGIELEENKDYSQQLGISKWKPPIPTSMSGQVEFASRIRAYTDIENIKKYPNVFTPGEAVILTEKLHGTCTIWGYFGGELKVSSKGNAMAGRAIVQDEKNAYWKMAEKYAIAEKFAKLQEKFPNQELHIYGETLGVQDLMYGLQKGDLDFRAFDIRVDDQFLDFDQLQATLEDLDLPSVPVLYQGPYDRDLIEEKATGRETFTGQETHVREGGVLRPTQERRNPQVGRAILKVISPKYLLRKGDETDFE